jgi:hypothetical protein
MPVAQKLCRCEHGVFMSRTRVHSQTLQYFTSKSFTAVPEAFSNAYPHKEAHNTPTGNKISGHKMHLSATSAHRVTKGSNYHHTNFK